MRKLASEVEILVACERSQVVTKAFRDKGLKAWSCDIKDQYGGYPEWHIKGDAIQAAYSNNWDLIIAHPPCTYLANSGVKHLYLGGQKVNGWDYSRIDKMVDGAFFFKTFIEFHKETRIPIAIENPVIHKYAKREIFGSIDQGKASQVIQPWMFGHLEQKATCFWLYELPRLIQTKNVYDEMMRLPYGQRAKVHYASPGKNRQDIRSETYKGIAEAMADQWGNYLLKTFTNEKNKNKD